MGHSHDRPGGVGNSREREVPWMSAHCDGKPKAY